MPNLGVIKRGGEIGYKNNSIFYIWQACEICGKQRWVGMEHGKPRFLKCSECASYSENTLSRLKQFQFQPGNKSSHWKGGRAIVSGYVYIYVELGDFFYAMAKRRSRTPNG
ncbi:hypothetical protein LCGC14_1758530, partial [marine sediment metagenome]